MCRPINRHFGPKFGSVNKVSCPGIGDCSMDGNQNRWCVKGGPLSGKSLNTDSGLQRFRTRGSEWTG